MEVEAALLTGGQSSRMGSDKATIVVDGYPLGELTAAKLRQACDPVTVLGRSSLSGCEYLEDEAAFRGPLAALSRFRPRRAFVFVCACDMPRFDPRIVPVLKAQLDHHDPAMALLPVIDGHKQPLCGLYRAAAFAMIPTILAEKRFSLQAWLDALWVEEFDEPHLLAAGVEPQCFVGVNTPEALRNVLRDG